MPKISAMRRFCTKVGSIYENMNIQSAFKNVRKISAFEHNSIIILKVTCQNAIIKGTWSKNILIGTSFSGFKAQLVPRVQK